MKQFQSFRLDTYNACLWREGQRLTLTRKAFAVLNYLVEQAGRLVTKEELMEAVWPETFVQEEILNTHIWTLRHMLGDSAQHPLFIETQRGRGYRFIAEVTEETFDEPVDPDNFAPHLFDREEGRRQPQGWHEKARSGERAIDLLEQMQTSKARKGMREAFDASSAQLGRAAARRGSRKR